MTKYVNFGLVMQVVFEACSKCKDTCDEFDGIYPDCNQCQLGEVRTKLSELPVLTVPPHGRLGDLDALAERIEYERFHHTHTDGLAARHHLAEYGHFLKAIAETPTIIPSEKW